jgi:hypothetical protein
VIIAAFFSVNPWTLVLLSPQRLDLFPDGIIAEGKVREKEERRNAAKIMSF